VEVTLMDQDTISGFLRIVWGVLFVMLGIVATLCLYLIIRSGILGSFSLRQSREVDEKAPWRDRIRDWFRHQPPPRE
jgi:hypothetical protein